MMNFPHSNCRVEIGVKKTKRLISDNTGSKGDLDTNAEQRAMLQYCNTADPETKISPATYRIRAPTGSRFTGAPPPSASQPCPGAGALVTPPLQEPAASTPVTGLCRSTEQPVCPLGTRTIPGVTFMVPYVNNVNISCVLYTDLCSAPLTFLCFCKPLVAMLKAQGEIQNIVLQPCAIQTLLHCGPVRRVHQPGY